MVFHWSLGDSKSPQVFRTRLSILAFLSNAVVWIVSTRPQTSKSSRPLPLDFFTSAMSFTGVWVTASIKDSSQYSGRSQQCCRLDGLHSSSTSKSSIPFNNPLVIVPKAPITIGTIYYYYYYYNYKNLEMKGHRLTLVWKTRKGVNNNNNNNKNNNNSPGHLWGDLLSLKLQWKTVS